MPATVVHSYFAQDVYDILPSTIKKRLDINRLKMFGQSTDSLMFYNFFSLLPGKKIRKFQKYFHENQTQEFFINLINYIKEKTFKNITISLLKNNYVIISKSSNPTIHFVIKHPKLIESIENFNPIVKE